MVWDILKINITSANSKNWHVTVMFRSCFRWWTHPSGWFDRPNIVVNNWGVYKLSEPSLAHCSPWFLYLQRAYCNTCATIVPGTDSFSLFDISCIHLLNLVRGEVSSNLFCTIKRKFNVHKLLSGLSKIKVSDYF